MSARFTLKEIGRGRHTSKNQALCAPGSCQDSLNFLHTRDLDTARLRGALDRTFAMRPANSPVLAAYEYLNASGTKLLLAKIGASFYPFTLGQTTALSSVWSDTGTGTVIPGMATANGFVYIANWVGGTSSFGNNLISNGTAAHTHILQSSGAPVGGMTLGHRVGTAVGNTAITVSYWIADVEPTTGEESPPGNAVTIARLANEGVAITGLTYDATYTSKRIYRSTTTTQPYLVTTLTNSAASYNDDSLDTALTTVSTVLDSAGVASIEKPENARHVAFYRGRIFFGNLYGKRSRLRWSKPGEPTQFSNASTAYLDVGKDDGGEITGLVVFRGSLVIFKTSSIWVLNGDQDETGFVLSPVVPGKGCVAHRTIVADGDRRILFLSECGVLSFDMQTVPETPLSDPIRDDVVAFDFANRADFFCAGLDVCNHAYLLSVTPTGGATTNTKTHMLNLNTGAWGRMDFNMGQIVPSCYSSTGDSSRGPIHDATAGRAKLFIGAFHGYLYEWDASTGADGVASGTHTGTITARTATTTTVGAAAFRTTGDGLTGLGMTIRRAADASYETVLISSNTATVITHAAFTGTAAAVGDTVYVGAYQGTLAYNALNLESGRRKHWHRIEVAAQKQTHTIPLRVGYTLDAGAAPTASTEYDTSLRWSPRLSVHRRSNEVAPYLDIIGVDHATEILGIDVYYDVLGARLPT